MQDFYQRVQEKAANDLRFRQSPTRLQGAPGESTNARIDAARGD